MAKKLDRTRMFDIPRGTSSDNQTATGTVAHPVTLGGVKIDRHPNGKPSRIVITMPRSAREKQQKKFIVGETWLSVSMAEPLARALFAQYRDKRDTTAKSAISYTNRFSEFLCETGRKHMGPSGLDSQMFSELVIWLDETAMKDSTKVHIVGCVRMIVESLRTLHDYCALIPTIIDFPENIWTGTRRSTVSRDALPIITLARIESACIRDMKRVMKRFDAGETLLAIGRYTIKSGLKADDFQKIEVLLALIEDNFNETKIRSDNTAREFVLKNINLFKLLSWNIATPRDLVPFAVMFAIRTAFNPDTVLTIDLSALRNSDIGCSMTLETENAKRKKIVADKIRSCRDQIRTFPTNDTNIDNPVVIFRNIERITSKIRKFAGALDGKLFIYRSKSDGIITDDVGCFSSNNGAYQGALSKFIKDNNLPRFTMAQIRPTISELVDLVSEGDIKAQQTILNHMSVDTTDQHYVSTAGRRRRAERLSEIINRRERWLASKGKIDSRQPLPLGTGRAATAGFECFDPYDSPIPGQYAGKSCSAWGECVTCPLASVVKKSPHALAHLIRLKSAIDAARGQMPPQRWLTEWAPAQEALNERWLPMFSDPGVFIAAEEIRLPPLNAIE
jgi:hypothetical protein